MVLPIGLETSLSRFPRATLGLIAACVAAFLLQAFFAGAGSQEVQRRYTEMFNYYTQHPGLKLPPEVEAFATSTLSPETRALLERRPPGPEGDPTRQAILDMLARDFSAALASRPEQRFGYRADGPWYNAVLAQFVHGGGLSLLGIVLLAGNMLLLYLLGIKLEDLWGGVALLLLFLAGGAAALVGHGLLSASGAPVVGLSGGIAALIGAFLVRLYPIRMRLMGFLTTTFVFTTAAWWVVLLLWLLIQGLTIVAEPGDVPTWANLGSLGLGALGALALRASPLEKKLLTEEVQRAEDKDLERFEDGRRWLELGSPKQALHDLRQYVAARPDDPQGWDALARALRMDRQDPAEAAAKAAVEWLEVGQTQRALGLMDEFDVRLSVREAARVHGYLEPEGARRLLGQALMAHPDDPYAPKAALLLGQTYPGPETLEVVQWVYEFTLDPDWAQRLKAHLSQHR